MSYGTGTITSATPAQAYMDAIDPLITAVTGWTLVEKYTISGTAPASNNVQYVYKSSGATNSFGTDFYFFMMRFSDNDTNVYFGVAESYATGTHKFIKYCPIFGNTFPIQADYSVGVVATSDKFACTGNMATQITVGLNTSGFTYWYSITKDRVVLATLVGITAYSVYLGLYDSFYSVSLDPFPLVQVPLYNGGGSGGDGGNQQSSNYGHFTREPGVTGTGSSTSHQSQYDFQATLVSWTPYPRSYRSAMDQKWWATRLGLVSNFTYAKYRGLLKPDVLYANLGTGYALDHNTSAQLVQSQASITPGQGDTLVIDGVNYVFLTNLNNGPPIWVNTTV